MSSSEQTPAQESAQDVLMRLERSYLDRAKTLSELKDQLSKLQEQVMTAHDVAFKAFQTFSSSKEQYLVNVINTQNTRLKQLTPAAEASPATREDNLVSS
jgi:Mg2+ and Co2+ transporter CorA